MKKNYRTIFLLILSILLSCISCNGDFEKLEHGSVNEYIYPYLRFDRIDDETCTATVVSGARLNQIRIPEYCNTMKVVTFLGFENPDDAEFLKELALEGQETRIVPGSLDKATALKDIKVIPVYDKERTWGVLPVLEREGYEFLGWFAGDVLIHEGMPMDPDSKVAVPKWREHVYIEHEGKAPTCTEPGWKPYRTCADCDYTDYEEIPALGHSIIEVEEKNGDCIEDGILHHWKCTRCGSVFSDSEGKYEIDPDSLIVKAPGRHALVHVDEIRATCSDTGIGEYWYCSVCGKTFADENGSVEKDITIIPKLPHTFTDEWHKDDKYHWHECSVCGEADLKVAHTWSEEVLKDPTPTEKGQKRVYCDICGKSYLEDIMPTGHEYEVVKVIAPTCTERGYTLYLDKVTGEQFKGDYVDPLGHSLQFVEEVPSTCTVPGKKAHYHCSVCGLNFTSETANIVIENLDLPLADHTYVRKHDSDFHWNECSVCGDIKDKVAHTLIAEPKYQQSAATCKDYAVYYKYCDCGFVSNETFEYVEGGYAEHKLEHVPERKSCTEYGNREHWKCTVCGKLFTDSEGKNETTIDNVTVEPTGHVFGFFEKVDEDHHRARCSVCGELYGDLIAHTPSGTYENAADLSGHYEICSACHEAYGELLPHDLAWIPDSDGIHHHQACTACGHVIPGSTEKHQWTAYGTDSICDKCGAINREGTGGGGFEVNETNYDPEGHIELVERDGDYCVFRFINDNADLCPDESLSFAWSVNGNVVLTGRGHEAVEFRYELQSRRSYLIDCLFVHEKGGGGSSAIPMTGNGIGT